MRVTNSMLVSNFMNNLNNSTNKLGRLQSQLASNRKYAHISEDPVSVIYSQQARFKLHKLAQYQSNVEMAQSWMTHTETNLMELNSVIQSAYESCIDAATDIKGGSDREIISKYMGQLRDHVLTILNSTMGDKYVFGGYNSTGIVDANGVLQTPFDYIPAVDFPQDAFDGMAKDVNEVLASGELSVSYQPPSPPLTYEKGKEKAVSFSYSMDTDGILTINVTEGTEVTAFTVDLADIDLSGPITVDLERTGAGGEVVSYGKLTLDNIGAGAFAVDDLFDISVDLDDPSVEAVFDTAISGLAGTIENEIYSANPPQTFSLSFTAQAGAKYDYQSGVDGGAAGDFEIGYRINDGVMQFAIKTPDGNTVLSNETWTIDEASTGGNFTKTFEIPGFGTVTLNYENGNPPPVATDTAKGTGYQGAVQLDLTTLAGGVTSAPSEPVSGTNISIGNKRLLTYNGIDLMTTDPAKRAILDQVMGQITEFDIGPGVRMAISESGGKAMLFSSGSELMNIYNMLDELTNALASGGDVEEIQKQFIKPLQDAQNHILSTVADVGGRNSRLDLVASRYEQDYLNYTQMKSDAEDADQAELIMNYKMAEAVYQAALATGAYIIQPTLMDFLR